MDLDFDIAILLPTRGRSDMLERSLKSLVEHADQIGCVQFLFGFDDDDQIGANCFKNEIQPYLDSHDVDYTAYTFARMGYARLHEYVNNLARRANAKWLVFWNDDAVMQTKGWDTEIAKYNGEFKLLAFHTHNDHPYSIFPIVPREWLDQLGYLSQHQLSDAWLSQQAYMLDIYQRIPVWVEHDRHDLTGRNKDATYQERVIYEGNPNNPLDFHYITNTRKRQEDCAKLATYLEKERGMSMKFFADVFRGTQDPWEKLKQNDVNKQMMQFQHNYNQR